MAKDDSIKKALTRIKAARKNGDTELRLGDIEWEPSCIPDGIETIECLESLIINAAGITDFSPIAKLTQIHSLTIYSVRDVDLTPLGKLSDLRKLEITGDGVTDLEFIRNLTSLESVHIQGPVQD